MNPSKFGSLANHRQEPWKTPLPDFIEACYEKRFKRTQPENVRTLEEMIRADENRRAQKREKKARAQSGGAADPSTVDIGKSGLDRSSCEG